MGLKKKLIDLKKKTLLELTNDKKPQGLKKKLIEFHNKKHLLR